MNAMTPLRSASRLSHSLTLRLALVFALLAFVSLALLGVALYRDLERELIHRDDIALITRIDQLRTFLNDSNTLDLIKAKPALFQNMMGNREALLTIGTPGQPPLLVVNPGNLKMPVLTPVAMDHRLTLDDVQHLPNVNGVPFSALAATIDGSSRHRVTWYSVIRRSLAARPGLDGMVRRVNAGRTHWTGNAPRRRQDAP